MTTLSGFRSSSRPFAMLASAMIRACFNVIDMNIPSLDLVSQTKRGRICT